MLCSRSVKTFNLTNYLFRSFEKTRPYSTAMSNMYFHRLEGSEQFQVSFQWKVESLHIDREFHLNRKLAEPLEVFLDRIKNNIEKLVEKKNSRKKKKQETPETLVNEWKGLLVKAMVDGKEVPGSVNCGELFFENTENKAVHICILDKYYNVVINAPWVITLSLPTSIMAGFPVYPSKISILFGDRNKSDFTWFKSKKNLWVKVGKGFMYTPSDEDINCRIKLKCVPSDGAKFGHSVELFSSGVIKSGPGSCPFEERHVFTRDEASDDSFRIMSYNILADLYAETDVARKELFPYCPVDVIALDYRKQLYLKEILGYNSDIICLQEVDTKVFEYDLKHVLKSKGCDGVFSKKGGTVNEGVATFFSTRKFRLLKQQKVVLSEEIESNPIYSHIWQKIKYNQELTKNLKDRATVVQVLVFDCLTRKGEKLVVANTHLYFSPEADHIRLLQGGMTMALLNQIVSTVSDEHPADNVSILICGDFNSTPEFGIYKLMTTKHIPEDYTDWKSKEGEFVRGLELHQPFSLQSACGTPEYTNYTVSFADCLDYIFYQTDRLLVKQVVPFPSEEVLKKHTAIPSVVFPSDHIALVADLLWK